MNRLQRGRFNRGSDYGTDGRGGTNDPDVCHMGLLTDYDFAKNNLFIRVSDADRNQEMLSNVPHTRVEIWRLLIMC